MLFHKCAHCKQVVIFPPESEEGAACGTPEPSRGGAVSVTRAQRHKAGVKANGSHYGVGGDVGVVEGGAVLLASDAKMRELVAAQQVGHAVLLLPQTHSA